MRQALATPARVTRFLPQSYPVFGLLSYPVCASYPESYPRAMTADQSPGITILVPLDPAAMRSRGALTG